MADRYWVGGTGTWTTTTTNWSATSGGASGASAPTAADNVIFDQAATYTVTLTGALTCLNFTVSAGTVTFTSTGTPTISGSMSLVSGTVWSATGLVTFNSTTTGKTITTYGTTINGNITFNGVGGGWTLGSALTTAATGTTTLTAGTLDLGGFDLITGIFSSTNTNTRSVAFGTNNIVLAHTTAAQTVLSMATVTGFTWSGTGGFTASAAVTRTYQFGITGGSTTNAPNLTLTGTGTAVQTFATGSWFNTLSFGTTAFNPGTTALNLNGLTLSSGGTFTTLTPTMVGTGTITGNSNTTLVALTINSTAGTTTLGAALALIATGTTTLTSGTLDLGGFDLTTGIFSSNNATTRSVVFGTNNIVLTHTTATTTVLSMATATGFTRTGTGGFTTDAATVARAVFFGSTAGGTSDNAPNMTITGTGTSVISFATGSWFNTLSFGTTIFNPGTTALNLNGLTLSSGGTFTGLTATMRGTGTITPAGKTIAAFTVNNGAGTVTLAAALGVTTYTQTAGTINFATFNLTCSGAVAYTAGTLSNIGTISCTTWTVTGAFTLSSGTITPSVSFVLTSGSFTYSGGTLSAVPTFTHTAGTVTLSQNYSLTSTGTYTLTAGTLTLNGFDLTTGIFSSSNANTRSIAFGTNNIVLAHTTAAQTVLNMATASSFTYTGTGGFTASAAVTRTYTFGTLAITGAQYPNLSLTGSGTAVQTFTTASFFTNLSFGTTAFNPGTTALNIYGSLTLSSGGTFTTLTPTLLGTGTLTSSSNTTLAALTINASAGTITLGAAFAMAATGTFTLTAGTLDLGGFDLTTGIFSSSSISTRSIVFGTNNIVLAHTTAAQTVLSMSTAIGFTFTGTGGFTATAAVTRTYTVGTTGGSATTAPNLTLTGSGTAIQTFTTSSWFKNLSFGTTAFNPGTTALNIVGGLTLSSGGTFTTLTPTLLGTGTLISNTNTTLAALTVNTTGTITLGAAFAMAATGTFTLTSGTFDLGGFDLTTGIFSSDNTNTRSIAFGTNNIVLAHTTAAQTVLNMANATGFTRTGTGGFTATAAVTRTFSFGSTGGTETNSPSLAITSGSAVPTINGWFNSLNFTGTTSTPATTTVFVNTLTLATGGTFTSLTPIFTSTQTWTPQFSKQLGGIGFNLAGGTLTLGGTQSLIATATTTLTAGTLDLGGFDLTTGIFSSTNTNTRSVAFGTNNIVLAHTTAATTVLSMATATGFTYTGTGGFTSDASVTRTYVFGTTGGTETNSPNLAITSGSAIPTITTNSWFNALNFTGTTSTPAATTVFVNTLTLATGGTYTALIPIFTSTQTWTPQFSKQLGGFGFNLAGGTLTLGGSQSLIATATTTLTAGTLDLGGYDLTTGIFSSTNTNTRSITFGTNNIVLSHTTAAQTVLSMATATGFTRTGTGGFTSDASVTRTFSFGSTAGGTETNSPNLAITSGAAIATITTNSWFNTLDFTGTTSTVNSTAAFVSTLTLATGGTYTGLSPIFTRTQTWTTQFSKQLGGIGFNLAGGTLTLGDSPSLVATGTTTLTNGTLDLGGFDLTTGIFSSSNANTRSVVFGTNNIVLVTTVAATTVVSMATATGFTCTGTGGFTTDASVTRTINMAATAGDETNAANVSLTGAGIAVVTITSTSFIKNLTFGSTAFALPATTLNIAGDLTLSSGGTFTSLTLNMVGTGTITSNGKTILALTINSVSGTTSLSDALTTGATATTTLTSGNLVLNGYTLTTGIFSSSNTNARSIAFGSGSIVLATTTGAAINLSMANATNFTCTSDGTYGSGTGGFQSTLSLVRTFQFGTTGGSAANAPRLYFVSGAEIPSITSGSWYRELDFGTTAIPSLNPMNQNLSSLKSDLSTSVLTALTATMVGTGSIRTNTSIGPLVINTSAITTTLAGTTLCTTAALTQGTLDLAGQTLTCSSTFTYNGGSLLTASGALNCTTFTINGPAFDFTTGTITPSTSFVLTSGSFTLNGGTLSAVPTFTHTAGTVTFNTSFSLAATGTYTFTAGTLTLADGVTLSTGIFSSTNTNTRSIAFGATTAGYISLTHTTAATTRLSMANATGFTESGPGGFTSSMGVTATFTFGTTGGSSSNAPTLLITGGAAIPTFTTGSWFNLLDFTGSTSTPAATVLNLNALTLASGGTYTALGATMRGTGTITPAGKTIAAFTVNNDTGTVTLAAALGVTTYTQTAGIIDFATFNLTCSGAAAYTSGTLNNIGTITCTTWTVTGAFTFGQGTITPSTSFVLTSGSFTYNSGATLSAVPTFTHTAGTVTLNQSYALTTTGTYTLTAGTLTLVDGVTVNTGIFSSTNSNTRSIAFGSVSAGNINLTHTTAATTVLSMTTATGFTLTGTGGFTVADMSNTRTFNFGATAGGSVTNAPSLTFTTGASIATLTTAGWFDNLNFGTTSFTLGTTTLNIAGDLILSSSGTYTALTSTMLGTGTITSNAKTIAALTVNTTGTATLADALTASGALTLTQGTLACSTFSVTSATFASTGSLTRSMSGTGTYTITGAGATAFSNASATGITITGLTISMTAATAKTFAGGGGSFATLNQGGAGALTISGNNSFDNLTATTRPSTITFTASSTQTFTNFTLSGISGSLVTINSSAPGTRAILSKASGTVSASFLSIQDSDATGGAAWYAGTTSTNVSNNLGWIFTAPPVVAYAGNFFAFF